MRVRRTPEGMIEIEPLPGRQVIGRFVDHATGYLVVRELRTDDPKDRDVYYTLVEQRAGVVVPPVLRAAELPAGEQVITDAIHGLQLAVRRTIDLRTGAETLHERLMEAAGGRVLATRESAALSARPDPSLLETHLARASDEIASEAFWTGEYRRMSLAARQAWWLQRVLHQMRVQGEAGFDEYALFNPAAYASWRAQEPDIDRILDFVSDHLANDGDARAEIDLRIGRPRRA